MKVVKEVLIWENLLKKNCHDVLLLPTNKARERLCKKGYSVREGSVGQINRACNLLLT